MPTGIIGRHKVRLVSGVAFYGLCVIEVCEAFSYGAGVLLAWVGGVLE